MSCCPQYGCDEFFGERFARRSAKRYRSKGLGKPARSLFAFVARSGLAGRQVLEVGGGIGALVAELVKAGAERGTLVEVVPSYEPFARAIFRNADVDVEFRLADLVADPSGAEPADLVVLNQVVCCTPDGPQLVGAAAGLTRVALAFSYPRERLAFRVAARLQNLVFRLLGRSFRVFVHRRAALVAAAEARGLRLVHESGGFIWATAGFERA
ncbi:MAG: class I SAM-dependent methyltransferase [Actinobacteria bacterium]|nr:class I SAM-dependent methyltransferase [Actinomycetota bacterium]